MMGEGEAGGGGWNFPFSLPFSLSFSLCIPISVSACLFHSLYQSLSLPLSLKVYRMKHGPRLTLFKFLHVGGGRFGLV